MEKVLSMGQIKKILFCNKTQPEAIPINILQRKFYSMQFFSIMMVEKLEYLIKML